MKYVKYVGHGECSRHRGLLLYIVHKISLYITQNIVFPLHTPAGQGCLWRSQNHTKALWTEHAEFFDVKSCFMCNYLCVLKF
jgi:hypothetical protein